MIFQPNPGYYWFESRKLKMSMKSYFPYVGADTKPAAPCPNCWPPTVLSRALKPSSSVGTPNCVSLDSYVRMRSLWALQTRASSYCRSLMALFLESKTSWKINKVKMSNDVLMAKLRAENQVWHFSTKYSVRPLSTFWWYHHCCVWVHKIADCLKTADQWTYLEFSCDYCQCRWVKIRCGQDFIQLCFLLFKSVRQSWQFLF